MKGFRADLTLLDGTKLAGSLIWRVPGFPRYAVTKDGRVYSLRRGEWRELVQATKGEERGNYFKVKLYAKTAEGSICWQVATHILIAKIFLGDCPPGWIVNHKDLNKQNNKLRNLEYITQSENIIHAIAFGSFSPGKIGENGRDFYRRQLREIRKAREASFVDAVLDPIAKGIDVPREQLARDLEEVRA